MTTLAVVATVANKTKRSTYRNCNKKFKEDVTATVLNLPSHYFLLAFHIVPIFFFPPTEAQTLGTAYATTAKSPKTDFLQKHSNLVCTANLGVNNTILVFN